MTSLKKAILLLVLFISCVIFLAFCEKDFSTITTEKIKSGNLTTDYEIEQVIKDIENMDLNAINIPIVVNIDNLYSSNPKIDNYSLQRADTLIKEVQSEFKDIKIIIEAYPWINNGADYETEYNPTDKKLFFKSWNDILKKINTDICSKYNVFAFNMASNFEYLESYSNEWIKIINSMRDEFNGLITFKTSWWYTAYWDKESVSKFNSKLENKIFNYVDFISVASYFELSNSKYPTDSELISCLNGSTIYDRNQNIKNELYLLSKKFNKPIFFGELGFPRTAFAGKHPWNPYYSNIASSIGQENGFKAYKNVFESEDFISGFSVFAIGNKNPDKKYYPSRKSIDIIKSWYKD